MNKIKLMYDVVKTMKEKDAFKGTLKAEGMKDEAKTFSFDNTFERNNLTGHTKAKTNTEVDCEGKKMKLENSINLEMPGGHGSFMKHIHALRHAHGNHQHGEHFGGIKEGWNKIAFVLGILNSIKTEEQEDKSSVLSLESNDIPEEIKKAVQEKMSHGHEQHECEQHEGMHGGHEHRKFMKELHSMEKTDFKFKVFISKNSEIEKVTIEVNGEQADEKNEKHGMKLLAELSLEW